MAVLIFCFVLFISASSFLFFMIIAWLLLFRIHGFTGSHYWCLKILCTTGFTVLIISAVYSGPHMSPITLLLNSILRLVFVRQLWSRCIVLFILFLLLFAGSGQLILLLFMLLHRSGAYWCILKKLIKWAGWNIFSLLHHITGCITVPIRNTWIRIWVCSSSSGINFLAVSILNYLRQNINRSNTASPNHWKKKPP